MNVIRLFMCVILFAVMGQGVANAAPPPAENFGKLPVIYDAALSPDADEIAAVISHKGKYLIRISELGNASAKPKLIALGDGVKPAYIKWANDTQVMLSFWQSEKFLGTPIRTGYLYTIDTKTLKGKILVDPTKASASDKGSRIRNSSIFRQYNNVVVDWLEDDSDHILMAYSDEDNNNLYPDLRRVNVRTGRSAIVKRGMSGVQQWYSDRSGELRIGQGRKDNSKASWVMRIRDVGNDEWHDSDDYPGLSANADIHGFTSNPNELIISAYRGKDTVGLYVYDLSAKSITRKIYHNDKYDASGVILSKDGHEIIGAHYVADTPETEMIGDNDTILEAMRRKFEGYTVDFVDQSSDGSTVLFKVSSPYDPGAMMIINGVAGKPENLGAMRPELSPNQLGMAIGVRYTTRDGQKIPSYVTLPPTITDNSQLKNVPFIVLPHGGPYGRDSKRFDYFAQFFASRGFGVLQMNFRGSEGYGKVL